MSLLDRVNTPADIRHMSYSELIGLASEIRDRIVSVTSQNGGHTAPNLGVVELTIALHYTFDTPRDLIIWDVGHQCYPHKLLTGRRDQFCTLRQEGGLAGFPKRSESIYDVFDTGHSGNSISVALGLSAGGQLLGNKRRCIAVIGDGSIVSGMAFEALNNAGAAKRDLVVVLNDNEMSIARSTGAMAGYLNRVITGRMYNRMRDDAWHLLGHLPQDLSDRARLAARKLQEGLKNMVVPSLLFEELGFRYIGPADGHDIAGLVGVFRRVREMHGPVLVHVVTRKGKGYPPAMQEPERFHGTGPFDGATGEQRSAAGQSFTAAFGDALVSVARRDPRVVAITAGMCLGTGLVPFREEFPDRFFDVGICEQHAVTFAAGLAQAGLRPVVAVYSTFFARAIDQVLQDVCLQRLPVVFAVDRAGLVGEDGPTHHGVFDLALLLPLPGLTAVAPRDESMLARMLEFAVAHEGGPVLIRYPRGGSGAATRFVGGALRLGEGETLRKGEDGMVLALGPAVYSALAAADVLSGNGIELTIVDAQFAKPIGSETVGMARGFNHVATVEEGTSVGGFGAFVQERLAEAGEPAPRVMRVGLPDRFIEHASRSRLLRAVQLDTEGLCTRLREFFGSRRA